MTMYWITANEDIKKWEKFDTATTDEESLNNTFQVKLYNYKEAIAVSAQNIKDNKSDFHPIINVSTKKGKSFNYETNLVTSKRESFCNAFAWDLQNPRSTATPYDNEEISAWLRKAAEIKLTVEKNILIKEHHTLSEAQKNQIAQLNAALERIKNETNTEFQKLKDENQNALTLAVNQKEKELTGRIVELSNLSGQLETRIDGLIAENTRQKEAFDKDLKNLELQSENQKQKHVADKVELQVKLQKDFEQTLAEQESKFGLLLTQALAQKQMLEEELEAVKALIEESIAKEVIRITAEFHKEVSGHVDDTMRKVRTRVSLRASTPSDINRDNRAENLVEEPGDNPEAKNETPVLAQPVITSRSSVKSSYLKPVVFAGLSTAAAVGTFWYLNDPTAAANLMLQYGWSGLAGLSTYLGLKGLVFGWDKLSQKASVENVSTTNAEDVRHGQSEELDPLKALKALQAVKDALETTPHSNLQQIKEISSSNVIPITPQLNQQQAQQKSEEEAAKQAAKHQDQDQLKPSKRKVRG